MPLSQLSRVLFLHTDSTHLSKSELFLQPEFTDDNFCSRDFLCVFTIASMFADALDNVFLRVDAMWMGKVYDYLGITVGINRKDATKEEKNADELIKIYKSIEDMYE